MRHHRNQPVIIIRTITSSSDLQFNRSHTFRHLLSSQISQGKQPFSTITWSHIRPCFVHKMLRRLWSSGIQYYKAWQTKASSTMTKHAAEWHTSTKQHSIISHKGYLHQNLNLMPNYKMQYETQISHQTVTHTKILESHIRLSHATWISNLTSDCHMHQDPWISYQTVTCNMNLKSHIRLSHTQRSSILTSDCLMQHESQISHQTVTRTKILESHIRLSHATWISNLTSDCLTHQDPRFSYQTVTCNM